MNVVVRIHIYLHVSELSQHRQELTRFSGYTLAIFRREKKDYPTSFASRSTHSVASNLMWFVLISSLKAGASSLHQRQFHGE